MTVDETGSEWCPVMDFGIGGIEPQDSTTYQRFS
jgi:hypothetical protein